MLKDNPATKKPKGRPPICDVCGVPKTWARYHGVWECRSLAHWSKVIRGVV